MHWKSSEKRSNDHGCERNSGNTTASGQIIWLTLQEPKPERSVMQRTTLLTVSFASSHEKLLYLNKGPGREKSLLSFTLSTLSETSVELRDWVAIPLPISCSLSAVFAFYMKTVILNFYKLAFPLPNNHAKMLKLYSTQLSDTLTQNNVLPGWPLMHEVLRSLWHSTKGESPPAQLYLAQRSPSCARLFSATLINSYPFISKVSCSKSYILYWNSL